MNRRKLIATTALAAVFVAGAGIVLSAGPAVSSDVEPEPGTTAGARAVGDQTGVSYTDEAGPASPPSTSASAAPPPTAT